MVLTASNPIIPRAMDKQQPVFFVDRSYGRKKLPERVSNLWEDSASNRWKPREADRPGRERGDRLVHTFIQGCVHYLKENFFRKPFQQTN
jgi:hypothetical protein